MKELSKEKIYGIVGTVLFHALLFLLLYLLVMEKPENRKDENREYTKHSEVDSYTQADGK